MTDNVAQPTFSICPRCDRRHASDDRCDFTAEEFNHRFSIGTPVLLWIPAGTDEPIAGRTIAKAIGRSAYIEDVDGNRRRVPLVDVLPCETVERQTKEPAPAVSLSDRYRQAYEQQVKRDHDRQLGVPDPVKPLDTQRDLFA